MHQFKSVKIVLYFAVLLLIAKPFIGFSMFSLSKPPAESNIFIKVFNKRKIEYNEGSESDILAIQKKLANPVTNLFLRFAFFLAVLFPAFFKRESEITGSFLSNIKLKLLPVQRPYLLTGTLLI
jgi:hypothetical protein